MQTKTMGPGEVTSDSYVQRKYGGGSWSNIIGPNSFVSSVDFLRTSGVNTPDYHRLRREGKLIPYTNFDQWQNTGSCNASYEAYYAPGNYTDRWYPSGARCHRNHWIVQEGDVRAFLGSLNLDASKYVQSAAARIYSSGWDALTFVAELSKTVALFTKFGEQTADQLLDGKLYNLWLQYRYGWRQLAFDARDISNGINLLNDGRRRFTERVGSDTLYSEEETFTDSWGQGTFVHTLTTNYDIGVRGSVAADISPPEIAVNPITTAWELLPYSFVIDWFVSVGSFLESMSFLALASSYTAAEGFQVRCTKHSSLTSKVWNTGYSGDYTYDSTCAGVLTLRHPTTIPVTPLVDIRLDDFKVMDLVAIIVQRYWKYLPQGAKTTR